MLRFSQRDPKWAQDKIGQSNTTLAEAGCTITSACIAHSILYPKAELRLTPDILAREGVFVSIPSDSQKHYIAWAKTPWGRWGIKFVWRNFGYDPVNDNAKIRQYMSAGCAILMNVQTKKGGQHWGAAWNFGPFGQPILIDPWDGSILWKPVGLMSRYPRFLGYAVLSPVKN